MLTDVRQHAEADRQDKDQDQREQEIRRRLAEHGDDAGDQVDRALGMGGGQDTGRQADCQRHGQRQDGQLQGHGKTLQDDRQHGLAMDDGKADVAGQGTAQPAEILDDHWLVDTEIDLQGGALSGRQQSGLGPEQGNDRVARDQPDRDEDQDRYAEQDRREQRQPTQRIRHGSVPGIAGRCFTPNPNPPPQGGREQQLWVTGNFPPPLWGRVRVGGETTA